MSILVYEQKITQKWTIKCIMTMNTFKMNSKYNIKYILKQIGRKLSVLDFLLLIVLLFSTARKNIESWTYF